MDCPIADYADKDMQVVVAVHNPSNLELTTVKIAVPHGNFAVKKLESGTNVVPAAATVLCNTQLSEDSSVNPLYVKNCQMYVDVNIKAGGVTFITLISDNSIDLAVDAQTSTNQTISIESEDLILSYDSHNKMADIGVLFNLTDKKTGESNPIGFGLKYWKGFQEESG